MVRQLFTAAVVALALSVPAMAQQQTACTMQMSPSDPRIREVLEVEGGWIFEVTANSTLNVRAGPGDRFPVIAELCRGELVVGLRNEAGWEIIIAPARPVTGYVLPKWLRRVR